MPTRNRPQTSAKGRRSMSAESRKSLKGSKHNYKSLAKNEDAIEMAELNKEPMDAADMALAVAMPALKHTVKAVRPHDIYDRTLSMPNTELRLMDVPVKSNLFF